MPFVKNSNQNIKQTILELITIDSIHLKNQFKIIITPSSINGKAHRFGENFTFGKSLKTNSFNFPDEENVGRNQFLISYVPCK